MTCTCGQDPGSPWTAATLQAIASQPRLRAPWRTIDIHAHIYCPEAEALAATAPAYAAQAANQQRRLGEAAARRNAEMFTNLLPRLTSAAPRLADMDAMGVDLQVLSPSPTQYHDWAEADVAARLAQLQTGAVARLVAEAPERFAGLGAVALQHPELAVRQLEAIASVGLKGAQISTRIASRDLSDPAFEVFWKRAAELGMVIFIHPYGCTLEERLAPGYLSNVIGQPIETTLALSHLIGAGVLDRNPALKLCAAHGGGYLPVYAERSDHAWQVRPEAATTPEPPSAYLRRIAYDSLVYTPAAVAALVRHVGASQVMLGSDYPFDMGAYDLVEMLAATDLAEADRAAIAGGNAQRLFNL
jgi:aminocarboxymuconate-semialdehyde decarboxylase